MTVAEFDNKDYNYLMGICGMTVAEFDNKDYNYLMGITPEIPQEKGIPIIDIPSTPILTYQRCYFCENGAKCYRYHIPQCDECFERFSRAAIAP